MSKKHLFQEIHEMLAKKHGLEPRDIACFRDHHFHQKETKEQIAAALLKRLPDLKKAGSYRYDFYLRRLAFLSKATPEQWEDITREITL